jgi:hypothetical protein
MRRHPLAFALLAFVALAACLPVSSKVPAGSTVGFKPDPALLGSWKARDPAGGGSPAFIHFLGNEDGTMTAVLVDPPQTGNLGDYSVYRLRVAALGGNHIVNVQEVNNNGKPSDGPMAQENMLLLCRPDGGGKLTLYQMDDKAVAALVKSRAIAGEVEPGQDGDVHITAEAGALDAFMATARASQLFSKPLVTLTRLE